MNNTLTFQVSLETASTDVWNPVPPINGSCVAKLTGFPRCLKMVCDMSNRNESGEYTSTTTDAAILAYLADADRPFQTAQSVADRFGFDRSQAYRRLQRLTDEGALKKTKVGGRAAVWWAEETPTDNRTAIEERPAIDIIKDLEVFIEEGDMPTPPFPSAEAVREDYHAHRHRKNLECLARESQ